RAPLQVAQRSGPAQRNAPQVLEQRARFSQRDAQVAAGITRQQADSRTDVATGQLHLAAALAQLAAVTALHHVPAETMVLGFRLGDIDLKVIVEFADRQEVAASAG